MIHESQCLGKVVYNNSNEFLWNDYLNSLIQTFLCIEQAFDF